MPGNFSLDVQHGEFYSVEGWILLYSFFLSFFMAVLGLCCCTQSFSSCGKWGLLFVAVRGLLIVVASLVVEHRL